MRILRHRQDDLSTGIWNAIILSAPFWLLVALALFAFTANATSPTKAPDPSQNQAQQQIQSTSADSVVAVDSDGPSVGFLLGGGSSGSDSTAACLERRPSWGFGFRGDKTKLNAVCWSEYVRQAEHEREMDLAAMELERARLELERELAQLERARLEQCLECGDK